MQPKRLSSLLTLSLVVCLLISSCRLNRTPNRPAKEPTPSVAPTQVAEPSIPAATYIQKNLMPLMYFGNSLKGTL